GSASIRTKAKTAGSEPLATQACIVPRCTQHRAAVVEFEVTFALEADRVVEGLGAVHELRPARCELDHPTHAALARADVIVADDKALALQLGGRIRVVDRHLGGRPHVDARDAGPPHRASAGKALVGRDDGLALRIMSGNDAAYFEWHGSSLMNL